MQLLKIILIQNTFISLENKLNNRISSSLKFNLKLNTQFESKITNKLQSMTQFLDKSVLKMITSNEQKAAIINQIDQLIKQGQTRQEIKELSKLFYSEFLKNYDSQRFKETISMTNQERFQKVTDTFRKSLSLKSKSKEDKAAEGAEAEGAEAEGAEAEGAEAEGAEAEGAEADEANPNAPEPSGEVGKQKLNEQKNQREGDQEVGNLKAEANKDLVAAEGEEDKNADLNNLPKPKVMDRPFTPDLMDPALTNEMYPDEFQGLANFRVWTYKDGRLKQLNPGKDDNKMFFSQNQVEMRLGEDILIIGTSRIQSSCKTLDAVSICSVKDKSVDEAFKAQVEGVGLNPNDTQTILLESLDGQFLLQIKGNEPTEQCRSLLLFLFVKNATRTLQFKSDEGGMIEVDSNAGAIRVTSELNGEDLVDIINVNSITSILYGQSKSEVELEYFVIDSGASEPTNKKIILKVPENPENVPNTEPGNKLWQSHNLQKSIDSAMNLQQYFQIEQKKEVFLTGIEDIRGNFDSKALKVLYSYKQPLKLMKQIENQMSLELKCLQKASIIVYFAELFSAQNPFIAVELLYFYQVKNVFPSVNPTFEGVEYYNWLKFFKTQKQVDDGHGEIYLRHAAVTAGISHRFLYQINERICAKGEQVTLADQFDILNQSAKHFDWKTNLEWEPQRDEVTSFVPHTKKPDLGQICASIRNTHIRGILVQKLAETADLQTLMLSMIEKFPRTSLQLFKQLVTVHKEEIGTAGMGKMAEGLSGAFPDMELTDDQAGVDKLLAKLDELDLKKLFLVKDAPEGNFKSILPGCSTIIANINSVLASIDINMTFSITMSILHTFTGSFNSLNIYLLDANKNLVEQITDDPMNFIKDLASDPVKTKLLLNPDADCKPVEDKGIKKFCENLGLIRAYECGDDELKLLQSRNSGEGSEIDGDGEEVGSTPSIGRECDPNIEETLGNLTEEQMRDSITSTYSQIRENPDLACELPKIFLTEVSMITDSVEEAAAKGLVEAQAAFLQFKSQTKTSEQVEKMKQFATNPDNSTCKPTKLVNELTAIVLGLSMPVMKKALCAAMGQEAWRSGFAKVNGQLFDQLAGSAEQPWWPLIPPNDFLIDEGNWPDINTYLSCNQLCLDSFIAELSLAGAFQPLIAFKEVESQYKELGEDQKTPLDLVAEGILAKEAPPETSLKEMMSLEQHAPHLIRAIMSVISRLGVEDKASALILALKGNEQCTLKLDGFYKLKEITRPMKKNAESFIKVFIEVENVEVRKRILNRISTCQVLEANVLEELVTNLAAVPKQDPGFKEFLSKEALKFEDRLTLATETDEFPMAIDEEVLKMIEKQFSKISDANMECLWNNLIECGCVQDVLKENDLDLLDGMNDSSSPEDESIVGGLKLSDREMRDLIIECSQSVNLGASLYGKVASQCFVDQNEKAQQMLAKVTEITSELPDDIKIDMETILSGSQLDAEKLKMIFTSNFANSEPEQGQIKEKLLEWVDDEAWSEADTIKCVFGQSLEEKALKKCTMDAFKGKMDCIKNPEACEYILSEECEQLQLSSACTPEIIQKIVNFNKDTAAKDTKLTITEQDCLQDGAKAPTLNVLMDKSDQKIEVFDKRGNIEKCDLLKIEQDVAEIAELEKAMEGLKDGAGGACGDGAGGDGAGGDGAGGAGGEGCAEMAGMEKDLLKDVGGAIQMRGADVLKDLLDKAAEVVKKKSGAASAEIDGAASSEGAGGEAPLEDKASFDLSKEKDAYIAGPDNLPRSKSEGPVFSKNVFIAKYACDLNFAFVFDEQLAECRKKGLCDAKQMKSMRMEQVNLIKTMDSESLRISPSDNIDVILSKIDKVREFIKPFTSRDDFGGIPEAVLDFTHSNLQKISDRQGIKVSCTADKSDSYRFVQKFMPEEVVCPDEADFHTMVILTTVYSDSISNKPVQVLSLVNKLRKVEGKVHELSGNMSEGEDVSFICGKQRIKGLVELAVSNKFKVEVSNAIASAIPALEGTVDEKQAAVEKVVSLFESALRELSALPSIMGAIVQFGLPPSQPPVSALEESFAKQMDMKKGVVPQADFWIMNKMRTTESKGLDKQPTMMNVLQAALTVHRFKSEGLVFRTLDVIKGIQKSLKSADYTRNLIKDVGMINFMSQGEVYLDQIEQRQMQRVEKAMKKAEEQKAAEKEAAAGGEKEAE